MVAAPPRRAEPRAPRPAAPAITVVVVSFNAWPALHRCLAALPPTADVVVVDNASPDGSAARVAAHHPTARLLALPTNVGFAAAVNAAAAVSAGAALLLLNPDAELPAGALARMAAALAAAPRAAILGFRQVDARGAWQLTVGPRPSLVGEAARQWLQRRLDRGPSRAGRAVDAWLRRRRPVPWVAGSALLVRRPDFDAVGGLDGGFFLYFEDIDFCLRVAARRGPGAVLYDPSLTLVHHRGVSAATAPALARRAYRAGQRRYWRRHRGAAVAAVVALVVRLQGRDRAAARPG